VNVKLPRILWKAVRVALLTKDKRNTNKTLEEFIDKLNENASTRTAEAVRTEVERTIKI
jgi:hypothetical protein